MINDNHIQDALEAIVLIPRALGVLTLDRTTGHHLLRAPGEELKIRDIIGDEPARPLRPRYLKAAEEQSERTHRHGEVFTPHHIVTEMVDMMERENPEPDLWRYVKRTWLEVCCGEGAFLTTRYHQDTGEFIPLEARTGILDRKLARIRAARDDYEGPALRKLSFRALQSVYGYEYQGDSLLIARLNLLLSFNDHWRECFHDDLGVNRLDDALYVISCNLFQMDGLHNVVPGTDVTPQIRDWEEGCSLPFTDVAQERQMRFQVGFGDAEEGA